MKLTPKQAELYNKIIEPVANKIIVQGSVQSGKTFIITYSLLDYAKGLYEYDKTTKYNGAIIGWDLDAIKRNIVGPLETFLDNKGYINGKDYILKFGGNDKYFKFLNMTFYFFGFNTKLSFNKILGGPLLFVWVDESARIYSNSSLQRLFR